MVHFIFSFRSFDLDLQMQIFRWISSFIIFLFILPLSAQNFEWASSGSNLLSGFTHSCVTIDGRLITGMYYEQPSYRISDGDVTLNSGTGKAINLDYYRSQMLVTCYDQKGDILWMIKGTDNIGAGTILGITSLPDGNVVLAYRSHLMRIPFQRVPVSNSTDLSNNKNEDINDFVFFSVIQKSGDISTTYAVSGIANREWSNFEATPDLGFIITQSTNEKIISPKGKSKTIAYNSTIKLKKDFSIEWHHKVMYGDESCCSFFVPACESAVGENGDVYISGNIRNAFTADGSKSRKVPVLDTPSQFNQPYESYVGCLASNGKLKWIKYSGSKSLIYDISVKNKHLVVAGKVQLTKKFFDQKIDTSDQKKSFLISMDLNGNFEWLQTFNAEEVNSVCQDEENNVFGVFRSKRSTGMAPLKIGSDTLPDSYQRIIVGSFDEKGSYRWSKSSKANISINSQTRIHSDLCGNLYYTGEMWFVLPINMALLDGAIASGRGYGGAPIAARLRTTIPDELLTINKSLVQTIQLKNNERKKKKVEKIEEASGTRNSPDQTNNTSVSAGKDTLESGRQLSCVAMPYPWKIEAYPIPTRGPITLKSSLSYTDPKVKIDLFDSKGAFLRNILPVQLKDAGEFELNVDLSDLAAGVYITVLKGSSFGASCRIIVTK
jgi:hypothetical protein